MPGEAEHRGTVPDGETRGLGHDLLLLGAAKLADQVVPPVAAKVKEILKPAPEPESPLILPPDARPH
jgi:hypothetical protein